MHSVVMHPLRRVSRLTWMLILAAMSFTGGCGPEGDSMPPARQATAHWVQLPEEAENPIRLPQALHAAPPPSRSQGGTHTFIWMKDGRCRLKVDTFDITSASDRSEFLRKLRELAESMSMGSPEKRHYLSLYVDWRNPCTNVLHLLSMLSRGTMPFGGIELWALRRNAGCEQGVHSLVLSDNPEGDGGGEQIVVRWSSGNDRVGPVCEIEGDTFSFPRYPALDSAMALVVANSVWGKVQVAVSTLSPDALRIEFAAGSEDALPFAYVAKTMDLAFGAGIERIEIQGIVITLRD